MKPILMQELKRSRGSLAVWCLVILLLAGFGMAEYPFIADNLQTIDPVFQTMPKLVQIMFGVYEVDFSTPLGYFVCMYFWCTLITFTHAVYLGGSIVSKELRDGTAEYLFAKPVPRERIVLAKLLAAICNLAVVAAVTAGVSLAAMALILRAGGVVIAAILRAFAGMFLTQLVLMALGLLCSGLFRSYKGSVRGAMAILIASYASGIAIEYAGRDAWNYLSPIRFFPVRQTTDVGLSPVYGLLTLAVVAIACGTAVRLYRGKDISV